MDSVVENQIIDGRYKILGLIGEGSMGSVYKAEQIDLQRIVAIKFLKECVTSSDEQVKRFELESKILSGLHHRNIIQIYSYGFAFKTVPYMVMEYLEGKSLKNLIIEKENFGLGFEQLLNIAIQCSEALSYAHKNGVIHRDLKPQNIFLVYDAKNYMVKILDFGLAKLADENFISNQKLTNTGELIGSPLYFSPEQCIGQRVDVRSDIYSLGLVLYECFSGKEVFSSDSAMIVLQKHLTEMPARLTQEKSAPDVVALEKVIFKAIQKESKSRFQRMDELTKSLKEIKSGNFHEMDSAEIIFYTQFQQQNKVKLFQLRYAFLLILFVIGIIYFIILWWQIQLKDKLVFSVFREHKNGLNREVNSDKTFQQLKKIILEAKLAKKHKNFSQVEILLFKALSIVHNLVKKNKSQDTDSVREEIYVLKQIAKLVRNLSLSNPEAFSKKFPDLTDTLARSCNDYDAIEMHLSAAHICCACNNREQVISNYRNAMGRCLTHHQVEKLYDLYNEACKLVETDPGRKKEYYLILAAELANTLANCHKFDEAKRLADKLKNEILQSQESTDKEKADKLILLANVYSSVNEFREANECYIRAYEFNKKYDSDGSTSDILLKFAEFCLKMKYFEKAAFYLNKAEKELADWNNAMGLSNWRDKQLTYVKSFYKQLAECKNAPDYYVLAQKNIENSKIYVSEGQNSKARIEAAEALKNFALAQKFSNNWNTELPMKFMTNLSKIYEDLPLQRDSSLSAILSELSYLASLRSSDIRAAKFYYLVAKIRKHIDDNKEVLKDYTRAIDNMIYAGDFVGANKLSDEVINYITSEQLSLYEKICVQILQLKCLFKTNQKIQFENLCTSVENAIEIGLNMTAIQKLNACRELGCLFFETKYYSQAEKYFLRVLTDSKEQKDDTAELVILTRLDLVELYLLTNQKEKAHKEFETAKTLLRTSNKDSNELESLLSKSFYALSN